MKKLTLAQAIGLMDSQKIYMLVEMSEDMTLAELKLADGFVTEEPEVKEPKSDPKPEKKNGIQIDHDRVLELYKEGRSIASIAMDCHCSDQTVRNHINKAVAAGEIEG